MALPVICQKVGKEQCSRLRIPKGPVVIVMRNTELMTEHAQRIFAKTRRDLSRKANGAELAGFEMQSAKLEVMLDEGVVEIDVVRYEYLVMQEAMNVLSNFRKGGSARDHLCIDAR